ncbi:cation H(+) antiporter 18-like [Olea europaea subsp. europaea]|uniref:Cation H(+) antiporter 18-like n=1 Tax=Olea europaea subsp. europaea TaxID=158383 RepID=A0A8S0SBI8_OLEEU|nr:cation H(+) antiporter 18-like [Olea europaea subsp. europaea]
MGKKALSIAIVGISLSFALGIGSSFVLRATIPKGVNVTSFLIFIGVALSITAFPILARIWVKLKLLTTDVGRMAMSATAANDVPVWILLALVIALSGDNLLCVVLMGFPLWVFVTDTIGIHAMFRAFVVGVLVPEGPYAGALVEKIVGTVVVSLVSKMPISEVLALGFLMDCKGLVELIVLNNGKDRKVLNDQTFAIMVLVALFTTFITTLVVMAVYKQAKKSKQN